MDGQTQLDVSGKILDSAIFSGQEALSLHSPGKTGSLAILNVSPYACALTYVLCRILLQ